MRLCVCHDAARAAGQSLSFASPKESNQRKGDPDDWPDPAMLRKKRNEKNSLPLRQFFVLIAFFFRFSGPINGDPSSRRLIDSRIGLRRPVRSLESSWLTKSAQYIGNP
jgi:hypothetical protein